MVTANATTVEQQENAMGQVAGKARKTARNVVKARAKAIAADKAKNRGAAVLSHAAIRQQLHLANKSSKSRRAAASIV